MISAFGFNHNAHSDDSQTQLRIDLWDPNTNHRLTGIPPWMAQQALSGCIDCTRDLLAPSLFSSLTVLGKSTPSTGCISTTVDVVPDTLLSLPSYTCTSIPANFIFYFSPLSTSIHLHCHHPSLKPLSSLSNFCPLQTVLARVTGEATIARDPRQAFSAHLGGSSAAQDTAEHPFLKTHLLRCLVWQRCDSVNIKFG